MEKILKKKTLNKLIRYEFNEGPVHDGAFPLYLSLAFITVVKQQSTSHEKKSNEQLQQVCT